MVKLLWNVFQIHHLWTLAFYWKNIIQNFVHVLIVEERRQNLIKLIYGCQNVAYFNVNLDCQNTLTGDFTRKFYYDILLDDKAGFEPEKDWKEIYKMLPLIKIDIAKPPNKCRSCVDDKKSGTAIPCCNCGKDKQHFRKKD